MVKPPRIFADFRNYLRKNSKINIDEKNDEYLEIVVPRTDWRKEIPFDVGLIIFIAIGWVIPLWFGLQRLNVFELIAGISLTESLLGLLCLIPLYILVKLYFCWMKYELVGYDLIEVDRSKNTICFNPSFYFRFFFFPELNFKKKSIIVNALLKIKKPSMIFGLPINKNKKLLLFLDENKTLIAPRRSIEEKNKILECIKNYLSR